MSKKNVSPKDTLRKQAEARLSKQKEKTQPVKKADTVRLIHELRVHQIELEIQNEELMQARAETEAALRQFTDLYDFVPVGYFTLTRDGAIQQANLTGAALLGVERGKLVKRRFGLFVDTKSRPTFNAFLAKVFADDKKQTCEVELLKGKTKSFWAQIEATTDEHGETCRAVVSDITERKQAEEALKESEEKFRILNTLAPAGIYLTDPEGNCLFTNPRWNEMAGLSSQEALGKGWLNGLHPEDRDIVFSNWEKMVKSEGSWGTEYRFRTPEGKVTWVYGLATPQRDTSGKTVRYIGLNMDITERKRAEAKYRDVFENAIEGIFQSTPDGRFLTVNAAMARIYGYESPDEMIASVGNEIATRLYADPAHRAEFIRILEQEGLVNDFEMTNLRKDGSVIWTRTSARIIRDAGGATLYYEGFLENVTERKRAEEEIKQINATLEQRVEERTQELLDAQEKIVRQEKLAVLGQMAGSVGHELRNPLGVISTAVYFLKMTQPNADEKIREYLTLIEKQVHISDKIVADLLDFTRIKSVDRAPVSVSDLIRQTLERFPAPENIQVELDIPADLPKAYADPQHAIQILGNLTLNACQAMKDGGQLVVSSRVQDEMIYIAVKDTGVGISPENMKKIFEPLFTTKPKGIGLGLAVCKKLIEANGGRIEVESEVGIGSTFTIYLHRAGGNSYDAE
jgi:PAS domain S-box-containing protein